MSTTVQELPASRPRLSEATRTGLVLAVLFSLLCAASVYRALTKSIDVGFDEVAHASYVAQMQTTSGISVELDRLKLLDPRTMRFSHTSNYLNHPSPYYRLMAWVGPTLLGNPRGLVADRLINVFLALAGAAALMLIPITNGWPRLEAYAFGLNLAAIPVLPALAGSINNDNLAFLGGALVTLSLAKLIQAPGRNWFALLCAGVLLAGLAKLTGLLLIGTFAGLMGLWLWSAGRITTSAAGILAGVIVVASTPYIALTLRYGGPAPDTAAQHAMLLEGAVQAGWTNSHRLGPAAYTADFIWNFLLNWMPSLAPRSVLNRSAAILPALVLSVAIAGAIVSARQTILRETRDPRGPLALSGMAAIAVTFASHVAFSYQRHLMSGWMLDAWPRYYLPLAAIVPISGLVFANALPARWQKLVVAFLLFEPVVFVALATPL